MSSEEIISVLPYVVAIIVLIYLLLKYLRNKKPTEITSQELESESTSKPTLDLKTLPQTHYLLEAGKREYRLSEVDYSNPDYLVLYTLGIIFNNDVENYDNVLLQSLATRIRLYYLLQQFSNNKGTIEEQIDSLAEHFLNKIIRLSTVLKEDYNIPSNEEEAVLKLTNVFKLIIDAEK